MDKLKRIIALLLVIGLFALYGLTLFFALTDNTDTLQYLKASIVATVIVPTLMWTYSFIYRLMGKGKQPNSSEEFTESTSDENESSEKTPHK